LILYTEKLKVKYSRLCARKVIKDSIYLEGRVNISSVLNKGFNETLRESHNSPKYYPEVQKLV
jgi:hypothetical protein